MSDSKIFLTYKDDEDNYQVESVWATKEGDYYRINNSPFLAPDISFNDLVKAKEEDGALHFEELVEASGHSTIQIIFFNEADVPTACKELEQLGCSWEGSHAKTLIAVDIPKQVFYSDIKAYLGKGEKIGLWSYKESCLAHKY